MTPIRSFRFQPTQDQVIRFVVSLLMATLLWGWVTQLQDPFETRTYPSVAIDTSDLPDTLQVVSSLPTATVELSDAASRVDAINAPDIAVRIDVSSIGGPGTYQVPLIVDSPNVNRRSVEPDQVSIQVDDRVTAVFPLTIENLTDGDQTRSIRDVLPEVSQVPSAALRQPWTASNLWSCP